MSAGYCRARPKNFMTHLRTRRNSTIHKLDF
jgi:hypothetical protein